MLALLALVADPEDGAALEAVAYATGVKGMGMVRRLAVEEGLG